MNSKDGQHAMDSEGRINRRKFMHLSGAGLGLALGGLRVRDARGGGRTRYDGPFDGSTDFFAAPPIETVRIGFVGVGGMGTTHVRNLVNIPGAVITAVADIRDEHARRAANIITEAGHPAPTLYTRGDTDFKRMCVEEDLDLVYNATPWRWHVPICLTAMENDKHTATEVPAATNIDDCWALVEAAEKHRKHCVMMENVNYGRIELLALSLIRRGLLGEVLHGECGYLHDLRDIKFADEGEGLWRRDWSIRMDANLYPTHGLGPVANYMDINRGNRFEYLVSMSGPARGLDIYAEEHYPPGHSKRAESYRLGDINVSLIKTAKGQTIYLNHDTNLPRPYSRINMVQGTRGLLQGYPPRVHIEGMSETHEWDPAEAYYNKYDHPLWRAESQSPHEYAGHGAIDFMEDARLIYCLNNGLPTDMNVYDAVALSAVIELTDNSNASGSAPMAFPDFTRGRWKMWRWPEDNVFGEMAAEDAARSIHRAIGASH